MNRWRRVVKGLVATLLIILLVLSPFGNSNAIAARKDKGGRSEQLKSSTKLSSKVSETSPPTVIQELGQALEDYQPQVTILHPKPNEVLSDNSVDVRFQVKDLPIFKDEKLGLGPHLHVLLDNRTYQAVYDINQPLVFADLEPGTHTIRVFASRPWHESFKNEGAYAQTTFHVFTKTEENRPDSALPLLTYSRPQGNYGAEPILLDFYLTNAPLHLVAQESAQDEIADWRIRCTINGESFVLDRWQPVYLKGFKPGKNWVQLEFLDEKGNLVNNVFNNTARVINYEPDGKDSLSRLMRGELSLAAARGIVDPNYVPEEPKPAPVPTPSASPVAKPTPTPTPDATPAPSPTLVVPPIRPTPTPTPTPESKTNLTPNSKASSPPAGKPKTVSPAPTPAKPSPSPSPSPIPSPISPEEKVAPKPSASPESGEKPEVPKSETPKPAPVPEKTPDRPAKTNFWERFRKPTASPRPAPSPVPTPSLSPAEVTPTPKPTVTPSPAPSPASGKPSESSPAPKVVPTVQPSPVLPTQPPSTKVSPKVEKTPTPLPTAADRPRPSPSPVLPSPGPSPTPVPPVLSAPKAIRSTPLVPKPTPTVTPSGGETIPVQPRSEIKATPQTTKDQPPKPQWFDQFKSRIDQLKSNLKPEELRDRRPESPAPAPAKSPVTPPEKVRVTTPQTEPAPKELAPTRPIAPAKPSPTPSPTGTQTLNPPPKVTEPSQKTAADEFYQRLIRSNPTPTVAPSPD
nr:hypothetical protein [Kovacikia minuta]